MLLIIRLKKYYMIVIKEPNFIMIVNDILLVQFIKMVFSTLFRKISENEQSSVKDILLYNTHK